MDRAAAEMTPRARQDALIAYLQVKLAERDWHGVRDAAADLEVLEAKYPEVRGCRLPELYCQDPTCESHNK